MPSVSSRTKATRNVFTVVLEARISGALRERLANVIKQAALLELAAAECKVKTLPLAKGLPTSRSLGQGTRGIYLREDEPI